MGFLASGISSRRLCSWSGCFDVAWLFLILVFGLAPVASIWLCGLIVLSVVRLVNKVDGGTSVDVPLSVPVGIPLVLGNFETDGFGSSFFSFSEFGCSSTLALAEVDLGLVLSLGSLPVELDLLL